VESPRHQHRWLTRYVAAVDVLAVLGVVGVFIASGAPARGGWIDAAVVALLAGGTFSFPFLRTGTAGARSYHLVEASLVAGLLLLDPRRAMAAYAVGVAVSWAVSGRAFIKIAFALGSHCGSGAVGILAVVAADTLGLPGAPGAWAPFGAFVYFAVNHLFNCVVFELAGVRRPGEPFLVDLRWSVFVSVIGTITGLFVGLVGRLSPGAVVFTIGPIALLFLLSRAHSNRARSVELLQGIVDAASDTHPGMSVADVERAVLNRVVQVLDCPDAEFRDQPPAGEELGAVVETNLGSRWLVAHPRPVEVFRVEEARLLRALAGMAGRALENAHLHDQLARQALHDPLTGLPNRRLVIRELTAAVARAQRSTTDRIGVAFLDLTGFKGVNDGMGHDAGDELLCSIAERLTTVVRAGDVVGRFGGDEYVVLFLSPEDGDVPAAANRVVRSFEPPFPVGDNIVEVGCNVGLALWPEHGEEPDELLRRADAAMYKAKRAGAALAMATPTPRPSLL